MEVSAQVGGVTPDGVREGDRTALQSLVERRGPSVMAFCSRVCGPANAERASAEAFARFRAAVRDAIELGALDPEALLRGATRHAAASMARTPSGPPPHGRLRSRGTQTCLHVPTMLAARANGALGEADLERLARHLDRCERCNAMGDIFRSAEAAYAEPAVDTIGSEAASALVAAMVAVPERAIGVAPAPLPGAPASDPQDGAFGHLPELEDEVPVEVEAEADAAPVAAEPEAEVVAEPEAVVEPEAAAEPEADAEAVAEPEPEADADPDATMLHLPVEHVEAPADELHAEDLAVEPLPDAAPDEAEHEVDLGETVEWDMVAVAAPQRRSYAEGVAEPHVALAPEHEHDPDFAPAPEPAPRRGLGLGTVVKVVLPVVVVAAFAVLALALTGVLGSSDQPAPVVAHHFAPRVQKPVLTPLPVTVVQGTSTASASTTAPAATGAPTTATDAASAPGVAVGTTP